MEWGMIWSQGQSTSSASAYISTECPSHANVVRIVQMTYENLVLTTQNIHGDKSILFALGALIENGWVCDFEETLEATRWFVSQDQSCIPTIPLSPHLFVRLNQLAPEAICIRPLWPKMGIHLLNRSCMRWMLENSEIPLWVSDVDMSDSDRTWLHDTGFQTVGELA